MYEETEASHMDSIDHRAENVLTNPSGSQTLGQGSQGDPQSNVGPRHKKLLQAYNKAIDMIVQQCSLQAFRSSFPPAVSGISCNMEERTDTQGDDVDLLQMAHSKAMKIFVEKAKSHWESVAKEMNIFQKLDSLDQLLGDPNREQEYNNLLNPTSPPELYVNMAESVLRKEIDRMNCELSQIQKENEDIRIQIAEKQSEISESYERFRNIKERWEVLFNDASHLEANLKTSLLINKHSE